MSFVDKVGGSKSTQSGSFVERLGGVRRGDQLGFTSEMLAKECFYVLIYREPHATAGWRYVYLAVAFNRLKAFRQALEAQAARGTPVDFEQYGPILREVIGDLTPEIMEEMQATYGIRHDVPVHVPMPEFPPKPGQTADQNNRVIVTLYRGTRGGRPIYAYLAVPEVAWPAFQHIIQSQQPFLLQDFGAILAEGEGNPPADLVESMQQLFGAS